MNKTNKAVPFVSVLAMTAIAFTSNGLAEAAGLSKTTTVTTSSAISEKTAALTTSSKTIMPAQAAPQRVASSPVAAHIVFTNQQHLWIMNANAKGAAPKQVTKQGMVDIVGWSYNGEWLLYKQYSSADIYRTVPILWVVKSDGTGAFPLDSQPVEQTPRWSPTELKLAYLTDNPHGSNATQLNITKIDQGKATAISKLNQVNARDFAWMPEGKALLVATPAAAGQSPRLLKMDLTGKVGKSFGIADKPNINEGIYASQAAGLSVSPDGRYVAYYLLPNSSSIAADGVPLELLDLQHPARRVELGSSLAYREWLAWSADSNRLAFVGGGGREATTGKNLMIAERRNEFRTIQVGQKNFLGVQPEWADATGSKLYYEYGKENTSWLGNFDPERVMVPGQRIWQRTADGKQKAVTSGTATTADYAPIVSPDGKTLFFLRLDSAGHGSLYMKTGNGQETELLRHVTGENGYYGNYLPGWVAVHWGK